MSKYQEEANSMVKWNRWPFAEQQMKKLGVKYTVEEVSIDDIDWKESEKNHARTGLPVYSEAVTQYSHDMKNGDSFPMTVLRRVGKKFITMSGNHRLPSAKAIGVKTVSAYVIVSDDETVIVDLPRMLHERLVDVSKEDRLVFASDQIRRTGCSVASAADNFGVSAYVLRSFIAADETRTRLVSSGVSGAEKLPIKILETLSRLGGNSNVQKAAAVIVCQGRLNGDETANFVNEIRGKTAGELSQMSVVEAMAKEVGLNGAIKASPVGKKTRVGDIVKVRIALSTLEKFSHVRTISQWGLSDRLEKERIIGRIRKLCGNLQAICKRST